MRTTPLAAEFADISMENNEVTAPSPAPGSLRALRDLELAMVGGGENTPIWGTTP